MKRKKSTKAVPSIGARVIDLSESEADQTAVAVPEAVDKAGDVLLGKASRELERYQRALTNYRRALRRLRLVTTYLRKYERQIRYYEKRRS